MQKLLIQNLGQFIDALNGCAYGAYDYNEVAQSATIDTSEVEPYINWNTKTYQRNLITRNEDYELLLMCWEPGQKTEIHDHNGQEGWIQMIDGELTEERYHVDELQPVPHRISKNNLKPNQISHINDEIGLHRIINNTDKRSMSMHLYVKPVKKLHLYNAETGVKSVKQLT